MEIQLEHRIGQFLMSTVTDAEKLTLNIKTVIAMMVAIGGFLLWGISNQTGLSNRVDSLKSQVDQFDKGFSSDIKDLKQEVKALNKIGEIETKLSVLQTRGSDAVQEVARTVAGFQQAIDAYRINGSPGEVDRMRRMEERIATLEKKIDVDEAIRKGKP